MIAATIERGTSYLLTLRLPPGSAPELRALWPWLLHGMAGITVQVLLADGSALPAIDVEPGAEPGEMLAELVMPREAVVIGADLYLGINAAPLRSFGGPKRALLAGELLVVTIKGG